MTVHGPLGGSWEGPGAAQAPQGSLLPRSQKAYLILHFPQPVHVAGLERPVLSIAVAHPVPPATMLLGSATVHPASLGLAVSRVGAPPIPALWRETTGEFPRVRPGLTLAHLYLACQPGTFGKDCEHLCQCPGETWACHPASGACVCAAGYHGTDCQQRKSGIWGSVCHSGIQGEGGNSQGCHVQGCCMFESTSRLCSRLSLSLQDAHLGAMGQAVNTFVSVSMVGPVTQPQEPATALLGSLGPTAALVRTQFAGLAG